MNSLITVALVEDQRGFRNALEELLVKDERIRCIGSYPNATAALSKVPTNPPAVLLVDLHLPGISGVEFTLRMKELLPGVKVLILTAYEDRDNIFAALRAGADGYLLKQAASGRIVAAIEEVLLGGAPMSSQIAAEVIRYFRQTPARNPLLDSLSPREQEVLNCLAQGLAYKEIASELGITFQTVSSHLKKIYEKLHVRSRGEAVSKLHSSTSDPRE